MSELKQSVAKPNRLPVREQQARSFEARRKLAALRRLMSVVLISCACAGGLAAWKTGAAERWLSAARAWMPAEDDLRGMRLETVRISGTKRMDAQLIASATGLKKGLPLLGVELEGLRQSVEAIGWVKQARIQRQFPDTLHIQVIERVPFALWQMDGALAVVDREGAVITRDQIEHYAHLPLVVGKGAALHAAALDEILKTQPLIRNRVRAAVRVGDRRWDLHLHSGVRVQLPERDPVRGLERLAIAERTQGILSRGVEVVDLRLPDRVTVRLTPDAQKRQASLEGNT
ncbi:MAG: cell division protein FtsQ/DivIB [Alphaproteobacteria bacterium]|nr:cell division protein FtsQ/DivIB [Alphaproteobacteria bacterium]